MGDIKVGDRVRVIREGGVAGYEIRAPFGSEHTVTEVGGSMVFLSDPDEFDPVEAYYGTSYEDEVEKIESGVRVSIRPPKVPEPTPPPTIPDVRVGDLFVATGKVLRSTYRGIVTAVDPDALHATYAEEGAQVFKNARFPFDSYDISILNIEV